MSRHEIGVLHLPTNSSEIRVPFNKEKFRRRQDVESGTAVMAVAMAVGTCGFPALFLYIAAIDPTEPRNLCIGLALFSLVLPLFIGLGAWPAMQTRKTMKRTLRQGLPALVISQEGIWDYSSTYVYGFVPWSEIDTVIADRLYARELKKYFSGIGFIGKSSDVLLRRKSGLLRVWMRADWRIIDRREIFIPQQFIDMPVEELVRLANNFRQR